MEKGTAGHADPTGLRQPEGQETQVFHEVLLQGQRLHAEVPFDEQIKVMCEVLNPEDKKSEIIYKPDMPSSPQFILGIEKAKAELGYAPKFDLKETFEAFENEKKLQRFSKLWGNEKDYQ